MMMNTDQPGGEKVTPHKKPYHEPRLDCFGSVQSLTSGAVGSTCDGNDAPGTGSNSNIAACKGEPPPIILG
jgi:hypothetical protein